MARTKLPARHERFCREYVIDLNGKRAAIAVKFSKKTAESQASRLLRNVKVQERIAELQAEKAKKMDLRAENVIAELMKIGFAKPSKLIPANAKVRALEHLMRHLGLFEKDNSQAVANVAPVINVILKEPEKDRDSDEES